MRADWFEEGLHFECTHCGKCCSGPPGLVEFTLEEGQRMAGHLGLQFPEFLKRYVRYTDEGYALLEVEGPEGFDCALLARDPDTGRTTCTAHAARPAQCRTWPFWPDTLRSRRAWRRAAERCEGIGRGPLVTVEEIRRQRDETPFG